MAGAQGVSGSGAGTPGPPPYDSITQGQGPSELPPPTYAEAVALLHQAEIHGRDIHTMFLSFRNYLSYKNISLLFFILLLLFSIISGAKPNETQADGSFSSVGTTRAKP